VRVFYTFCLLVLIPAFAVSQGQDLFRGSIPETLLRPGRGEAPRYPVDVVIGELGRGAASVSAFNYANLIGAGFLSGQMGHPALASINSTIRESNLSAIQVISPVSFRIGGGREEPDGAISFLVRFIGREQGITGEMYIRYVSRRISEDEEGAVIGNWVFEELLLEEARDRAVEHQEAANRNDFYPYERFF